MFLESLCVKYAQIHLNLDVKFLQKLHHNDEKYFFANRYLIYYCTILCFMIKKYYSDYIEHLGMRILSLLN